MTSDNTTVHRLLDEAFAGVAMTPDVQDLKEEIRANLLARVAELQASGTSAGDAAGRALAELGDVRDLIDGTADGGPGSVTAPGAPTAEPTPGGRSAVRLSQAGAAARNRVRPRPGFVVGVVLASAVAAGALAAVGPSLVSAGEDGLATQTVLMALLALAAAWIVGTSLAQETASSYPLPWNRAALFGVAAAAVTLGTGLGVVHLVDGTFGMLVVDVPLLVAGVVLFAYLAATQTNRHKPWALEAQKAHASAGNRFEEDPAAAARFGIYTVVTWTLAGVAAVVIGLTAGWQWSWLPGVAGWVVFMLMLAAMLFGSQHDQPSHATE